MAKATTFPMACSVENPNRLCHWGAQQPPWQYGLLHCVCAYESQWPAPQRIQADFTTEVSNNHCHNGPLREEILQPPKKESGVLGPRMPPLPPSPILTPDPRATAVTHVPKLQTLTVHVLFVCLFCVYPHLGHWSQHHWGLGSAPDSGVTVSTNAPTLSSSQLLGCSACTNISDTRATTTVGSQCPNPWSRCCSVDIHSRAQLHSCSMVPMHQTPMPTLPRRLSWAGHGSKRDTLCHDNPSRRRKIRSSLEDFTTKDPIRPHHCFSHGPGQWRPQQSLWTVTSADGAAGSSSTRTYLEPELPHPTQPLPLYHMLMIFSHQNLSINSGRGYCSIKCRDINTSLQ